MHKNPYSEGTLYAKIFAFWQKHGVITRAELLAFCKRSKEQADTALMAITVVLSPREQDSKREGAKKFSKYGNRSAHGEVYFAEPLKHKAGEDKRFRLHFRKKVLPRLLYDRATKQLYFAGHKPAKKAHKVAKKHLHRVVHAEVTVNAPAVLVPTV